MSARGRGVFLFSSVLVAGGLCAGFYAAGYHQGVRHGAGPALSGTASPPAEAPSGRRQTEWPLSYDEKEPVSPAVAGQKRAAIESDQKQRLMRNLSANLAMPGMNRMIQEQQRVLMTDQYQSLIETLGLNEKEKAYFLDLLTARQMYHVDLGMKLMTGMLSDAERNELLQRVGAGIAAANREIDWFLNDQTDSDYFQYYERTEGERSVVDSVGSQLVQAGMPLEEGVDRELIAIMYEQLRAYPFSVNLEENGQPVFPNFTSENIDTFVSELRNLRDPMVQQASGVLTPEQLAVFAGSFDQYVAFYDQRLRMVQQLFNPEP